MESTLNPRLNSKNIKQKEVRQQEAETDKVLHQDTKHSTNIKIHKVDISETVTESIIKEHHHHRPHRFHHHCQEVARKMKKNIEKSISINFYFLLDIHSIISGILMVTMFNMIKVALEVREHHKEDLGIGHQDLPLQRHYLCLCSFWECYPQWLHTPLFGHTNIILILNLVVSHHMDASQGQTKPINVSDCHGRIAWSKRPRRQRKLTSSHSRLQWACHITRSSWHTAKSHILNYRTYGQNVKDLLRTFVYLFIFFLYIAHLYRIQAQALLLPCEEGVRLVHIHVLQVELVHLLALAQYLLRHDHPLGLSQGRLQQLILYDLGLHPFRLSDDG